jgi:predicted membrane-bound spermidine synthase
MFDTLKRLTLRSMIPFVLIFFTSAGVMALELVASRIVGRHLGSSIYTWSSIIAVILFGISVGNYLGGKAADRYSAASFLPWLSILTAVASVSTLVLCDYFGELAILENLDWPLRIIATIAAVFTLPAVLMGMMTPYVVKMHVESTSRIGSAVGSMYAWGAVGSILGTVMTGFFLIPFFKVSQSLLIISFFFSRA